MDEEKKWMLMTYYCPTHGNSGMLKPIENDKDESNGKKGGSNGNGNGHGGNGNGHGGNGNGGNGGGNGGGE